MSANRRRLLKDHASLHSSPPPDFFLPTPPPPTDDLTTITLHLVGPTSTPFESGLFTLVLKLPQNYPTSPPKATFRTKIFHPNVCDRTGDVCVDTLKREWNDKLTLKDVCVVIRCLLVEPNPTSSLNEEAGRLMAEEWGTWERRAKLWTKVHAGVPEAMKEVVEEVRKRDAGEEEGKKGGAEGEKEGDGKGKEAAKKGEKKKQGKEVGVVVGSGEAPVMTSPRKTALPVIRKQKASSSTSASTTATTTTHKRISSSAIVTSETPTVPEPPTTETTSINTAKEVMEKDKSHENEIQNHDKDKQQVQSSFSSSQDENDESIGNTPGKENASAGIVASGTSFTSPAAAAVVVDATISRSTSPVKQLSSTTQSAEITSPAVDHHQRPSSAVTTTTQAEPDPETPSQSSISSSATLSSAMKPPKPTLPQPSSLLSKKRPSEESLLHTKTKAAKTMPTSNYAPVAALGKKTSPHTASSSASASASSSAASLVCSSTKSKPGAAAAVTAAGAKPQIQPQPQPQPNMGIGTKITMKKKVGGGSTGGAGGAAGSVNVGKPKEARKGLKRF